MYELPHELPNDLRITKLRNCKKLREIPGLDNKCIQQATQKPNFDAFYGKMLLKIISKTFHRKIHFA